MKILQLPRRYTKSEWGGTETVIKKTTQALNAQGAQSEIWTSSALSSIGSEIVDGIDVKRFSYVYPYLGLSAAQIASMDKIGGNLFSFPMMLKLFQQRDFDIYHLHTGKRFGAQAAMAARGFEKPYVITLHGSHTSLAESKQQTASMASTRGTFEWGKFLGALVGSRSLLKRASAVICVDPQEPQRLAQSLGLTNTIHIPNGVDESEFDSGDSHRFREHFGFKADDFLISCISRIDAQKNQMCLLRAFSKVVSQIPSSHLVLIGPHTSPDYVDSLKKLAAELKLSQRVHIFSQMEHGGQAMADAYAAADVFALCSSHEPFGIVVLEAWCASTPVVASRVGGLQVLVDDEENGLLVDPDDDDGFAVALLKLAKNPLLAKTLAQNGKEKALTNYTWKEISKQLLELYSQVQQGPICAVYPPCIQ